jgi:hypothetical protein
MQWAHHVCAAWRREQRDAPTRDGWCHAFIAQHVPGSPHMMYRTARRLACVVLNRGAHPRGRHFRLKDGAVHVHMDGRLEAAIVVTESGTLVPICLRRMLQFPPVDALIGGVLGHRVLSAQSHKNNSLILGCSRGAVCVDVSNPLVPCAHWHTRGVARGTVTCVDLHDVLAIDGRKALWQVDLLANKMRCIARGATAVVHAHEGCIIVATGELLWKPGGMLRRMPFKVRRLHRVNNTRLLVEGAHVHALVRVHDLSTVCMHHAPAVSIMPNGDLVPARAHITVDGAFAAAWCRRQAWITLL